jgi:hypothetical protein
MHKDFHLYGTYLAARLADFTKDDARDIACAAQAVDDFTYGEYGSCAGEINMAFTVRKSTKDIFQTLWTVFHFLPELDMTANISHERKFKTAPHGAYFERLTTDLQGTFGENQGSGAKLARAGVTMHVLADTYAHEGFSGLISGTNKIEKAFSNMGKKSEIDLGVLVGSLHVPTWVGSVIDTANIGHGTAGCFPDISWLKYTYMQDGEEKDRCNPSVFAKAFGKMIEVLSIAKHGTARTGIEGLQKDAKLRITEERTQKIKNHEDMWFLKDKRITQESRDTVFKNFMSQAFALGDNYTPENLDADYKTYINNVTQFAKENKDNPSRMIEDDFLEATIWHRINVLTKIWEHFPNFPDLM